MRFLKSIIGIFIVMLFFINGKAQFYNGSQMSFGKNRVQYKEFFWTYYRFDNYDIYFYLGGKELALYTANFVDEHLDEIEDKLDTGIDDKIQFIVYNNLTDLKQSNIGLINDQSYNTGGVTHIIGKKVFLYFDGNHDNFDRQIRSGIAQSIVNQLLYGSSIGSQIKNTSLFPFPAWYMNGLVSYVSEDWNTEIDNWVKDGVLSGKFDKFNQLTGQEATYAGHAFWKYIAEKYGESSISNIIYMAKVSRRLESGFLYILGVSYKNLQTQAMEFYKELYGGADPDHEYPQESLLKKVKPKVVYSRLKISPDGNNIAYTSNWSGQYRVFLQNVNTGKKKRLMKAGFRLEDKVDYSYPLLAWHPSGKILAILIEKKGEVFMYYYMPDEKKFEKLILYQFEKVLDMSYSDDGRSLVMSAVQKGQSDIFVYDIGSNSFDQITKDQYDDLYPRFINNSKEIIFSSNRISDTIRFENKYEIKDVQKRYDLFLYKYEDKDNILRRVTKTPLANEIQPMEYEHKYITYLSDENGIYNRYIGRFDSTISYVDTTTHYRYFTNSFAVTNYSRNILEHDVVPEVYKYAQVLYKDRKYFMQIYDQLPIESLSALQLENTPYMEQQLELFGVKPVIFDSEKPVVISESPKAKSKGFSTVKQSDAIREIQRKIVSDTTSSNKIDTDNYQFDIDDITKEDIKNWDYTLLDVPLPDQRDKEYPT